MKRGSVLQHLAGQRIEHRRATRSRRRTARCGAPCSSCSAGKTSIDVAAHAEGAALEVEVVALVLHARPGGASSVALVDLLALAQVQDHRRGSSRAVADAVDARHRGDDDHVVALEQRACVAERRMLLDVLVDRRVLLDVDVACAGRRLRAGSSRSRRRSTRPRSPGRTRRNSLVELRRQRLVGREHQRRPAHARR